MGLETWSQVIENLSYQAKLAEMAAQGNINLDIYRFLHSGNASFTPLHQAEWRTSPSTSMPRSLRKNFTDPVTCLMKKPSYLDGNSSYPGVKSRFDDWAAAHIEFDRFNHFTGTFFHWHRYALWVFEQDLRNQCGYTGHLPYWDWGMTAPDPTHSEIFNGDPYSMGSNGAPILTNTSVVFNIPLPTSYLLSLPVPQTNVSTPPGSGTGGGCISPSGPFGTAQAHLGPTLMGAYLNRTPTGTQDAFRYNPRCIVRDLNSYITRHSTSYKNISEAIANYTDLSSFQAIVQSDTRYAFTARNVGLHAGGHVGVGGDPMADKPSTPGDPMWFLHHAMIDRVWIIWQNQDLPRRMLQTSRTKTILNYPPSANVTLDDLVDLAYLGGPDEENPPRRVGELVSTVAGPFCYRYA